MLTRGGVAMSKGITNGVKEAARNLGREIVMLRKHWRGVRAASRLPSTEDLKLHLGCGPKIRKGWINIDCSDQADITLDLREPLPFVSGSCSMIYSEHFLEHVNYPEPTRSLLTECLRVLRPGGLFSVGVPDTEWPIAEYLNVQNQGYFRSIKGFHPAWCETDMEHINYHFRQDGEHLFAYDFETLKSVLTRVGFHDIQRRDFNPALDSHDRKVGTLYVDARKPK